MLRMFAGVLLGLVVLAGSTLLADGEKGTKGRTVTGAFKGLEPKTGTLIISLATDGGARDLTFKLDGVRIMAGQQEATPKPGDRLTVTTDSAGKVTAVTLGGKPAGGKDGERPAGGPKDGERKPGAGPRDGGEKPAGPRDGEKPAVGPRDGEKKPAGSRDGEKPGKADNREGSYTARGQD